MDEQHDAQVEQIMKLLSDETALQNRGISEDWVRKCAALVIEYRELQARFEQLEAELSENDPQSPGDTVVL